MAAERMEGPLWEPVSVAEARGYLRIDGTEDDAALVGFLRVAREICEAFTGQVLINTRFRETVSAGQLKPAERGFPFGAARAMALARQPVRAITAVWSIAADGTRTALPVESYALEEDARGTGRLLLYRLPHEAVRVEADYWAGLGSDWNAVPEALRHGMLRLTAHLYTYRDSRDDTGPPAAVAALWRPFRKTRLF